MKRRRKPTPGLSPRQRAWSNSPQCADVARRASQIAAEVRAEAPKCGARRKGDGQPCQLPGLENGRCRLHGGLTPKGNDWHRPRWPNSNAPAWKLEKKLRELELRRKKRAARLAKMSPEERERFERLSRARQPSSISAREAIRRNREVVRSLSRNPGSTEESSNQREIDAIQARIDALRALLAAEGTPSNDQEDGGE